MRSRIGSLKLWLIIGAAVIVFLPPFAKYQELKYKNKKLEEKIIALREESRRLAEEKNSLETDINYVEKKAREKLDPITDFDAIFIPDGAQNVKLIAPALAVEDQLALQGLLVRQGPKDCPVQQEQQGLLAHRE